MPPSFEPPETHTSADTTDGAAMRAEIQQWGRELGFQQLGFAGIELEKAGSRLQQWLERGYHGEMTWMASHGEKRWKPEQLLPGTLSVICVRMDYLPADSGMIACLKDGAKAYLSRYALGRDYHKLVRKRLATLGRRINERYGATVIQRPFVDSAPVMEKPLAATAGLGWIGKNTLLLNRRAGSWFFLGELFTSLPLASSEPGPADQCGKCRACMTICPTQAFPEPYVLDARRCISYLTIEHAGSIPVEFRSAIGNRVFGCDDCQIVCPWNRFARPGTEPDFSPRHGLDNRKLIELFNWSEEQFLANTAGSPIRRIGYQRWLRNLAIALGNGPATAASRSALETRLTQASPLVREHILWALAQLDKPRRVPAKGLADPGKALYSARPQNFT